MCFGALLVTTQHPPHSHPHRFHLPLTCPLLTSSRPQVHACSATHILLNRLEYQKSKIGMNPPDPAAPQGYNVSVGRSSQQNHPTMPIVNGDQMRNIRMSSFSPAGVVGQQSMASPGASISMLSNGGDTAMMDPPLMMSMNITAENGMGSLDPQLSSVGDQFGLATSAPLTSIPTEYATPGGGGSTLTEFTKRRNWSQRILEELQDFLHVLTPSGKLVYVSPSSRALTGFGVEDLLGKYITSFIHADDSALYVLARNH